VLLPAVVAGGLVLGLVIGRWWALLGAVGVAVWLAVVSEVEVSRWFLAAAYGVAAAVSIAAGVLLRRVGGRRPGRS
jgi:hypothetical protein